MNELKVGLLTIFTLGAIGFVSFLVTSNQSGFASHIPYQVRLQNAAGIFPKTPIRVAGVVAGRIKKIELVENHALVTFEILERINVPTDSHLLIKSVGFLGDKYLEIRLGKEETRLPAMSVIEAQEGEGLENLTKDISAVMDDVKAITKEFRGTFAPENGTFPMQSIIKNMDTAISEMARLTHSMNRLFDNDNLGKIINDIKGLSDNLKYQSDVENEDSLAGGIDKILLNVEKFSEDLRVISSNIRTGRGTAGKFLVEEGIADEVQKTLAGVNKLVGRVDSIRTDLSVFSGNNSLNGSETDATFTIFSRA